MDRPATIPTEHRAAADPAGRSCSEAIRSTLLKLVRMREHLIRNERGATDCHALWRLRMWLACHPYIGPGGCAELRTGMWPVVQTVAPGNAAGASLLHALTDLLKPGGVAPTGKPGPQRTSGASGGSCQNPDQP